MITLPSNKKVETRILEKLLDYNYLTNSYKIYFFLSIYKEVIGGKQKISFEKLICRMICEAWYPILQYHLNFGISDQLKVIVNEIRIKYNIRSEIKYNELLDFLLSLDDKEIKDKMMILARYVPYRLISPFYEKYLAGRKDGEKNSLIADLSLSSGVSIYKIYKKEKYIDINDKWFEYIYYNQNIVQGWINYKLVYYLQKKNPNVPAIPFKLNPPYQRDLRIAKEFWSEIFKYKKVNDIYTGSILNSKNKKENGEISIDHFIPWSFVLHDQLWNLIPTFKNINSQKSNKLPNLDNYLEKYCNIQYEAFTIIREIKPKKALLEDYLTINNNLDINDLIKGSRKIYKEEFSKTLKSTILPLYQIAYNQGYTVWECND